MRQTTRPAQAIIDGGVKIVETAGGPDTSGADKMRIPIIASGGFGDGRGLVAALSLGAEGINMGTRFCATLEAPIHPNLKQAYIDNDERGSFLVFRQFRNTARVGKSEVSDEVVRRLVRPEVKFEDVRELVAGVAGRELLRTGDLTRAFSGRRWCRG